MNSENIFEGISYIDGNFIDSSAAVLKRRRFDGITGIAKKAAGIAAALAIVFGGFMIVYGAVLSRMTSDNQVPPAIIAEIDGARYLQEGFHSGNIRGAYGLPEPSEDIKGEYIGSSYVSYDSGIGGSTAFYALKDSVDRKILLGYYNGELSYWIMGSGGESFDNVCELLEYHGYHTVEDVHTMRVDNREIKDREKISEVWNALLNGTEITENEYVRLFQGEDYDEANAQEVYSRHADSHRFIGFNYGELTYIRFGYYTDIDCFDGLGYIVPSEPVFK